MLRNGGRFSPEWVAGIGPESVAGLERKTHIPTASGEKHVFRVISVIEEDQEK